MNLNFVFLLDKRIIHIQQYKNHHDENMIILRHHHQLHHHQNPKDRVMIGRFIFERKEKKLFLFFSISCNNRRRNPTKTHTPLNDSISKTKILKIHHLPSKTTSIFH